jgi:hypothetical protein
MKRQTVLVFLLGLLVGAMAMFGASVVRERQKQARTEQAWRQYGGAGLLPYFRPRVRVPLPPNVDLSTNTWQQLVFWEGFAAFYSYQGTNTFIDRPSLRSYVFRMDDPWSWFTYANRAKGQEFAREVLSLRTRGLSYDELVRWVSTNYTSNQWYCEDDLDAFQKGLSTKKD